MKGEIDYYPAKKNLEVDAGDYGEMIHPFQNSEKIQGQQLLGIEMSSAIDDHEIQG